MNEKLEPLEKADGVFSRPINLSAACFTVHLSCLLLLAVNLVMSPSGFTWMMARMSSLLRGLNLPDCET